MTHSEEKPIRLELKGKLVGKAAAAAVSDAVARAVAAGGMEIDLDLRSLAMVDSAGLEALLACRERCAAVGGGLTLRHACSNVERVLRITRLDRELEVAPD